MGLMDAGKLLTWEECEEAAVLVKAYGIEHFIKIMEIHADRYDPIETLKWGDEIEYMLLEFDSDKQNVKPYNKSEEVIEKANAMEKTYINKNGLLGASWLYEFGRYMVEGVPGFPYDLSLDSVLTLQRSMSFRRWKLTKILPPNVKPVTMTSFPALGTYYLHDVDASPLEDRMTKSVFITDDFVTLHPRFPTLAVNVYKRRNAKVACIVPIYKDVNTKDAKYWENSVPHSLDRHELQALSEKTPNPLQDMIYMDAMAFGMGMCCSQSTYMCPSLGDARYLYDQFVVLAPLWLAMTACTSALRGMISGTDTRWDTLSASVDARSEEDTKYVQKSRYSSVSLFISDRPSLTENVEEYNDLNIPINEEVFNTLTSRGIDPILAKHVAYMFIRIPLVIFRESLEKEHLLFKSHFDNIQSTNWNSVRLKLPLALNKEERNYNIGWRVEFRPSEVQLTDFENAAYTALVSVLVQLFFRDNLDLYIPISLCDENFERSKKLRAVVSEKFWFRQDISSNAEDRSYKLMTLREIFLGSNDRDSPSPSVSPSSSSSKGGLLLRCIRYVEEEYLRGVCTATARETLHRYFDFIALRLNGEIDTNATFLRRLVMAHPDYKQDSVVPSRASYDVCQLAARVGALNMQIPEIYGPFTNEFNAGFENKCGVDLHIRGDGSTQIVASKSEESLLWSAQSCASSDDTTEEGHGEWQPWKVENGGDVTSVGYINDIRRYLYSICQMQPNCKGYTKRYCHSGESTFVESDGSCADRPHESDDEGSTDQTDVIIKTNTSNKELSDDFGFLDNRFHDFVLSEDFTKMWMAKNWFEIDEFNGSNVLNGCNQNIEGMNMTISRDFFDSENDVEYFRTVSVLSS